MTPPAKFLDLSSTRRGFILGSLSAGTLLALSACAPGGGSTGSTTVSLLTNNPADWEEQINAVVTQYQAANPGVSINVLNIADGANFDTKIKTQALSKTLPDLTYVRTFDIASQVRDGWLAPLDELNQKSGDPIGAADFYPAVKEQFSQGGQLYAVPEGLSAYGIYVNTSMFAELGIPVPTADWTWDDFYEVAGAFTQKDGDRQTRWGGFMNLTSWAQYGVMMSNGGSLFNADGTECVIVNDENVETFQQLSAAVKSGAVPRSDGLPTGLDPFAGGLLGMYMNGSWYAAAAEAAIGDKFEWTILPLPKGTTGKREIATAGGGWALTRDAKDVDASWSFLSYLSSPEVFGTVPYAATLPLTARSTDTFGTTTFPEIGADAAAISYPTLWAKYGIAWGNRVNGLTDGDDPRAVLTLIQDETNR